MGPYITNAILGGILGAITTCLFLGYLLVLNMRPKSEAEGVGRTIGGFLLLVASIAMLLCTLFPVVNCFKLSLRYI